jgi:hypothetical protein
MLLPFKKGISAIYLKMFLIFKSGNSGIKGQKCGM